MEEESVETIREANRNRLFLNRRKQKNDETDVRRAISSLRLNSSDVATIVNKLKTKASITASELKSLQNALIDEPTNIEVVLNTHGALRGLVRELTGHDVGKQIASAGCLCNLALGDSRACCTIAKAAGAYLVASLDSLTTQLAASCAWALGNLGGAGARACDVITAQGALAKLCDVTGRGEGGEVGEAALYGLTHLAYVLKDDLLPEHLHKIVQSLSQTELSIDASRLLFIISCHNQFTPLILSTSYPQKIIENLPVIMENHLIYCKNNTKNVDNKCCSLIYLIRVLANVNSSDVYDELLKNFVRNNLVGFVRRLLEDDEDKSLWWLLGNILNCCGDDNVFFKQLIG